MTPGSAGEQPGARRYAHLTDVSAEVRELAARVRLVALDVDGTLNDGTVWYPGEGPELKPFNVQDGLGLKLLGEHGIGVALITARESAAVVARARDLGVRHVHQRVGNKRECLQQLLQELGLDPAQCAYMGDDLPDLCALALAGLSVAPANAHPWIAERVHWRTGSSGGHGAVRELCDLLLAAQGHADALLARYQAR